MVVLAGGVLSQGAGQCKDQASVHRHTRALVLLCLKVAADAAAAGLSELDGVVLTGGAHSTACFLSGCLDTTPSV
jgi:hypothetical protein